MPANYTRSFITLRQDSRGYDYKNRSPMGRCILEVRGSAGKLSVVVQDLKPEIIYKIYLVSCEGGRSTAVPVCSLYVDTKGKAETKWDFDADNVGGSGISADRFNIAAIFAPKKDEIATPLVGFKNMPIQWKDNLRDISKTQPDKPTVVSPLDKPGNIMISKANDDVHKSFNKSIREFKNELVELEKVKFDYNAGIESDIAEYSCEVLKTEEKEMFVANKSVDAVIETVVDESIKTHVESIVDDSIIAAKDLTIVDSISTVEDSVVDELISAANDSAVADLICIENDSAVDELISIENDSDVIDSIIVTDDSDVIDSVTLESDSTVVDSVSVANDSTTVDSICVANDSDVVDLVSVESDSTVVDSVSISNDLAAVDSIIVANDSAIDELISVEKDSAVADSISIDINSVNVISSNKMKDSVVIDLISAAKDSTVNDTIVTAGLKDALTDDLVNIEMELANGKSQKDDFYGNSKNSDAESPMGSKSKATPGMSEIDYIFINNIAMNPFVHQNRDVKWVRVSLREVNMLPAVYKPVINSPFVIAGYEINRHLILGETEDESGKFYILGVPDTYKPEYRHTASALGFSQFKCCDDIKDPSEGEHGYWLMPVII